MIWGLPKKVLVTGASSGIGRETAKLLSAKGVELFLVGRNLEGLKDLPGVALVADLAQKEGLQKVLDAIKQYDVDCVINSAGLGYYGVESASEIEEIIKVDIEALVTITRAATQYWMEQKKQGVIVNVASALAFVPAPYFSVYAASKAFVVSFSRAENYIYKRHGIYVLSSCPGKVATDFQRRASRHQQEAFASTMEALAKPRFREKFALSEKSPTPSSMSDFSKIEPVPKSSNFPAKASFAKASMVMAPQKAAVAIVKQISLRQEVSVFDWRTRALIFIGRLFPHFAMKIIYKTFKAKI